MKKILKTLAVIVGLIAAFFVFLIVYATITDYKPDVQTIVYEGETSDVFADSALIDILIWNIGYCGLSADMDFFYDGGKMVRTSLEQTKKNINSVKDFLIKNDTIEFILIQEVDKKAKRSYKTNQYDSLKFLLHDHMAFYGKNYDVFFVPLPFTNPLGSVDAGLGTFSKYKPTSSVRFSFPGNYDWPKGLFMLDRCFLVNRYKVSNGKELLVINTHNSAYDDGSLRSQQMKYLKDFLFSEYEKGNYIIVGGDWNQSPANFQPDFVHNFDTINHSEIADDYLPESWNWIYSNKVPTNRRLLKPYIKNATMTTVIDFYLISPNIEKLSIETIDLDFKNSDHQPVIAKIKLKP